MPTTTNMNLNLPTPSSTIGPDWASDLNTALTTLDSHDHTTGKGQRIPTAGLNINADLDFNANNLTNFTQATLKDNSADPGTNISLYAKNGDLYFRDSAGNNVRVTSGGALDLSGTGGITGDYTTTSAVAFYTDSSKTFFFQDSVTDPAILSFGTVQAGNGTVSLPAYTFTGDKDTGIYSGGTNILNLGTAGTQAVSINASQETSFAAQLYLPNNTPLNWRNNADSAYLPLSVSTGDRLLFNSNPVVTLANGTANHVLKMNAAGTDFEYGLVGDDGLTTGIDAAKIHDGSVSNTEFGYLNGVSNAIQSQLDSKVGLGGNETVGGDKAFSGNTSFANATTHTQVTTPSNPDSGTNKLFFKSDDKLYKLDSAGNELEVGSGTGSGEINYIDNGEFESNTDGWATYDDGASATPVDGTGGTSSNLTISAQDSTVLRGAKSLKIAKGAADAQGEGVSYDFSIKGQDTSKKLKIQFDFKTDEDAAYAAGDLTVYIYDVTNSTLITPADTSIISGQNIFQTSFNSTTSTSYRLIFHVATTNASAYDLYLDNVIVGPGQVSQGAAVGGWTQFTPDFTNVTLGNGTVSGLYRRVGENMEGQAYLNFGSTSSIGGNVGITVPNSKTIDTNLIPATASTRVILGNMSIKDNGSTNYQGYLTYSTTTTLELINDDQAVNNVSSTSPITFTTGDVISVNFSIPITEWAGKGIVPMLAEDNLSEWQSWDVTSSWTTNTTHTGFYRRVGGDMELRVNTALTGAPNAATTLTYDLPLGLTLDTSRMGPNFTNSFGSGVVRDFSGANAQGSVEDIGNTTQIKINWHQDATNSGSVATTSPWSWNSNDYIRWTATVPILEWAGSQNSLVGYSEASSSNLGLVKKNKWQRRTLGTSVTGTNLNNTLTDLSLANLEIGKTYEVNLMAHLVLATPNAATEQVRVNIQHDGASLGGVLLIGDQASVDQLQISASAVATFTATATTVTFVAYSVSSDATTGVYIDSAIPTYVEIKELNNYGAATTDFTP